MGVRASWKGERQGIGKRFTGNQGEDDAKDYSEEKVAEIGVYGFTGATQSDERTAWLPMSTLSPRCHLKADEPARAAYCPKIAWFMRATTPAVCASERWA